MKCLLTFCSYYPTFVLYMKRIIIVTIALTVLMQSIGALWLFAGFYSNQQYFAQNLCVYKTLEVNTCKGECVLVKILKHAQDQEQNKSEIKWKDISILSVQPVVSVAIEAPPVAEYFTLSVPYAAIDQYSFLHASLIFHPPIS